MEFNKEKIAEILEMKGAIRPCHRCGKKEFTIIKGFSTFPIHQKLTNNDGSRGPNVPCVLVACTDCGSVNFHAIGPLGLLESSKKA